MTQQASKQRLVVIGNGMAGCRVVEDILKRDPGRYEITIFGAEPRVNYDRIMLSPVLAGEKTFADIVINDEAWYRDNAITLHAGRAVQVIDREARVVRAEGGLEVAYDRLILNCDLDLYLTFDNVRVGELQAGYLVDKLKGRKARIVRLMGSKTDNNAFLFKQGQDNILNPAIAAGDIDADGKIASIGHRIAGI